MKDRLKHLLTCALIGFACVIVLWSSHSMAAPDLIDFAKPQTPPSPRFNPPSREKFELGRKLFFESRLSGGNTMSCASCHLPQFAWTDLESLSPGENGKRQFRRTPPLQDVGWNTLFGRDGRFESLEGFILGPIANENEMNQNLDHLPSELSNDPAYRSKFKTAFGKGPITLDKITQSLGVYVRTLTSGISPFDRWVTGDEEALSASAKSGYELFAGKAGCSQCHSGWRFSDQQYHDIGIKSADIGRGKVKPKDATMQHAFVTPSLRNVAVRPPYMHNGSIQTLEAVIDHYTSGGIRRSSISDQAQSFALSDQEKVNLIEFLKSLTDDTRSDNRRRVSDDTQIIDKVSKP